MYVSRMFLCLGFLTLFSSQPLVLPLFAQSDACPPSITPQPDESKAQDYAGSRVIIDSVEFQGANPLSDAQRSRLANEIQQVPLVESPSIKVKDWLEQAIHLVRELLLDTGYFKSLVLPKAFLIRAENLELHYALRIVVEDGPQYRLGNVQFESTDPDRHLNFNASLLRQQLELKEGDIFNVSRIRESLEQLYELYQSKGYIDEVPTPETTINDKDSIINLVMKIEEGNPYRIARIEVLGLSPQKVQAL
jgi:outer membrane protein insertion porin family